MMKITAKTKVCCIIGNPVEYSLSPQMHNAAFEALGLDYVFVALKVKNATKALEGFRSCLINGIVVTMPHKQTVIKNLDRLDESARVIGAVNAVKNNNGILIGTNSDWIGAVKSLEEKTSLAGKKVALLGAGGAARAIIYGLIKRRAEIFLFNRTLKKAEELAREFDLSEASMLTDLEKIKQTDIIINATSVGMEEDKSPIPKEAVTNQLVFDIVYTPHRTKLIRFALEKKCPVIYGYKMVLHGGTEIFRFFSGRKAPTEVMEKALLKNLH